MIFFSFFFFKEKKKEIRQEFFFSILLHSFTAFRFFRRNKLADFFKNVFQCL